MSATQETSQRQFDPPGPGPWEQDPVHLPRAITVYWTEVHPEAFAKGTADFDELIRDTMSRRPTKPGHGQRCHLGLEDIVDRRQFA